MTKKTDTTGPLLTQKPENAWDCQSILKNLDIRLIYAQDLKGAIGYNQQIPWHIHADMERFKKLTTWHIIVMGSKTYESLPEKNRPLKNRLNILVKRLSKDDEVLLNSPQYKDLEIIDGYMDDKSLLERLNQIEQNYIRENKRFKNNKEDTWPIIWIIGGAYLLERFKPYANKIYRTLVYGLYKGDTFVEPLDLNAWQLIEKQTHQENQLRFDFEVFAKV